MAEENVSKEKTELLDDTLLNLLKKWRAKEGATRHVPLYIIASNKTLESLVRNKPTSLSQLKAVSGIGPKMLERSGDVLLDIIRTHLGIVSVPTEQNSKLEDFLKTHNIELNEEQRSELTNIIQSGKMNQDE